MINENILDAIDILTEAALNNAKYDKTVVAQIISCEDETKGMYKCSYQGITIFAYASHPMLKYDIGDNVYILTVADDVLNESKIIIGKRY